MYIYDAIYIFDEELHIHISHFKLFDFGGLKIKFWGSHPKVFGTYFRDHPRELGDCSATRKASALLTVLYLWKLKLSSFPLFSFLEGVRKQTATQALHSDHLVGRGVCVLGSGPALRAEQAGGRLLCYCSGKLQSLYDHWVDSSCSCHNLKKNQDLSL